MLNLILETKFIVLLLFLMCLHVIGPFVSIVTRPTCEVSVELCYLILSFEFFAVFYIQVGSLHLWSFRLDTCLILESQWDSNRFITISSREVPLLDRPKINWNNQIKLRCYTFDSPLKKKWIAMVNLYKTIKFDMFL